MTTYNVTYRELDRSHNAEMLEINRRCPIAADFTFYFDRSPDFFLWPDLVFDRYKYVGIFDGRELVGYIMIGFRSGWTGTAWGSICYFGDARLLPEYRGRGLMQGAAHHLETLIPDETAVGFCLIKHGNVPAFRLFSSLESKIFSLQKLCTFDAISIPLLYRPRSPNVCVVRRAKREDASEIVSTLNETLEGRLFAPFYSEEQLLKTWSSIPGFGPEQFYVAEESGQMKGVLALWDMDRLHRTLILRYNWRGQLVRSLFNLSSRFLPLATALPPVGHSFRSLTALIIAVRDNDPLILRDLLAFTTADQVGSGYHLIHLGFTSGDPLRVALHHLPTYGFRSDILLVVRPTHRQAVIDTKLPPYIDLSII